MSALPSGLLKLIAGGGRYQVLQKYRRELKWVRRLQILISYRNRFAVILPSTKILRGWHNLLQGSLLVVDVNHRGVGRLKKRRVQSLGARLPIGAR